MNQTLTPRQIDILRLAGDGLDQNEIAAQLGIAVPTVKTHLIAVKSKLGVNSKRELVRVSREFFTENNQ